MEDGLSSFWGPVTSTHEWCEPNYVHSSYIAEFFNTISNVPCIILALIGLVNSLRQRFEKRFSVLHISNMILAIGSMLYHATLQRLQQQGDETPMVWEMLLYIYILYSPDWHYRSTMPTFLFLYGAVFAIAHSQLRFDIGFKVHYALLCLLCIPRMYKYYIHTEDKSAKRLAKMYVATLLFGSFCWLVDRLFCKKTSPVHYTDSMDFSLSLALTALSLILSIFTFQTLIRKLLYKKKYHPIGGTIFHQLMNFDRLHHYMTDLAAKYRTYRLITPFRNEIYTSDPLIVEYILKTNFDNYGKGSYNYHILSGLLGDGIFTVDGDKWREQRKVSSYEFSARVLRDFSTIVFRKNVAKLANVVSEAANSNQTMDIQALFMKSTLDSIFKVAFGVELDSMCGSSEEGAKFGEAFDNASAMTLWRYVDIFWKMKKAFNVGSEAKLKKNIRVIDDFVYKLIQTKVEEMHKSKNDSSMELQKEDILTRFLQFNEADPKYLRDIILNFIIAGKDTTATALSWFIYVLCKHPLVQEKVAQEIKEATKTEKVVDVSEFASSVSEEALEKMHYLHAALTETLRLYPAVPVDAKQCLSDDTMPDGFCVNKGDFVAYQPYAMGRMRFLWGDDAEDFRPERWMDEKGFFKQESPFKFTAFQAGPRICLGKEFAYRQMKIFSTVLLRYFVFKLSDSRKPVNYRTMINLHIDGGLHVRAFHRVD